MPESLQSNRYKVSGKEEIMSKKIIAVNAGPRKGWNTDTLITEASKGAESAWSSRT